MTNRPLIKPRSAYTRRRLVIFFLLATIIAVSILTGFSSGLNSDSTIYTAYDRIVMWKELPASGTPEDYDLLDNVRFTAQRIFTSPYYRGKTSGKVLANLGMGIKYTQNVDNTRVVKGNTIFVESISSSSLVSVAEQRYYVNKDNIFRRPSVSISGNNVTYADSIGKFIDNDYYKAYGVVPNELCKLQIDETTIISVRDDNARSRDAAKRDADQDGGDASVGFDVPDSLVPDGDGNFSVTLQLDPAESTKYSRNEVRTLASADQNPYYYSSGVTIKFDKEWKPITVTTFDNYDIAIPVLGAMNCSTTMTETFYDIDDENGEIPEQAFFEDRIGSIDTDVPPDTVNPSIANYLASAFAQYIDGSQNLDLEADLDIAGTTIDDLALSVNIGTMDIRAKLGRLAVEYTGDKVYITLNDIAGYFSVDKFVSLIDDPTLSKLLSGVMSKLPDLDGLFGDDILDKVFVACEMTIEDGIACIRMPFELAEGINIDASLYINDEDKSLVRITGVVSAFGMDIKIDAKPNTTKFPQIDDTYKCLDAALDFIPDALNTAVGKTYGVSGTLAFNDYSIGVDAYIERDDNNGIVADATINTFGLDVGVKYINNEIYISVGNINIRAAVDELSDAMSMLTDLTGLDIKKELGLDKIEKLLGIEIDINDPEALKKLLPQTVTDWIAAIRSLDVTENTLELGARLIGMPVRIGLERDNGGLSGISFGMDIVVFDKITKLSADLDVYAPPHKTVTAPDEYVELGKLLDFIPAAEKMIEAKALSGNVALAVGNTAYDAQISVDLNDGLKARIVENTLGLEAVVIAPSLSDLDSAVIYLKIAEVKVYGSIAQIKELIETISPALPGGASDVIDTVLGYLDADGSGMTDVSNITALLGGALGAVQSVVQTEDGISAKLVVGGTAINADIATDLSSIAISATALGKDVACTIDGIVFASPEIQGIYGAVDLQKFAPVIDAALPLIGAKSYTLGISGALDLGDGETQNIVAVRGKVTIELPLKIGADITIGDVALSVVYDGENVFVNIDNKLKFSCVATKDGIVELLDEVKQALSSIDGMSEIVNAVDRIGELLTSPVGIDFTALLGDITLTDGDNGDGTEYIKLGYKNNFVTLSAVDGRLCSIGLDLEVGGQAVSLTAAIGTDSDSGAIRSLDVEYDFVSLALDLSIDGGDTVSSVDHTEYTDIRSLVGYIEPIMGLATRAENAKTVTAQISAKLTFASGNYLDIESRDLTVALGGSISLSGQIILFAGTGNDSEVAITLTFADGVIFVEVGGIALKLEAATDIDRLYDIISAYLPEYLNIELQKLIGKADGASAFSDISLIIERIKQLAAAPDARSAMSALFGGYGGLSSDSTLKKLLGTVMLSVTDDALTVGADLGFVFVTLTPIVAENELVGADMTANMFGTDLYVNLAGISLSDTETAITPPADSDKYVSIVDFANIVDGLVGTFTQRTDDGSITFEVTDLDFTYAEKATDGLSVSVANMEGQSALKGKITPHTVPAVMDGETVLVPETTKYGVSLELHVTLDMSTFADKCGTIGLELYLIDNYPASPLAYVNYTEFYGDPDRNIGELVSIDADSVLQILAAAMDIIGVDDNTVEKLLGDYRKDIDTSIFDSMDIVGLDVLKTMLDNTVTAIDDGKQALKEAQTALDLINTAGSIDVLRVRLDDVKALLSSAMTRLRSVISLFDDNDEPDKDPEQTIGAMRGERVKNIVDGITFVRGDGTLSAEVDNTLTTGADGTAGITVSEADGTLTGIDISNLDVNTALIEGGIAFVSGKAVEFSPIPTAPAYSSYSDFSTVKSLLFDVMNTANLLEFGIGGYDTTDSIDVTLDLKNISGGALLQYLAKLDISIKYDIKVKLIDAGRDENGKTIYKTAAIVELFYENCTANILGVSTTVIADCVTRLYFYDNVLYVQGVSGWGNGKATVGSVDTLYTAKRSFKDYSEVLPTVNYVADTSEIQRVNVMYTIDEFFYMINNDMNKFFKEFLFYLVPLSKDFTFLGLDLQNEIIKLMPTAGSGAQPTDNTIARIFKGYRYDDGKHSLVLGLKELAGSSALSDLYIDIVGKNDGDDESEDGSLLNNYISDLAIATSIQDGLVAVKLSATLNNVNVTGDNTIASKGFAPTDVTTVNSTFKHNGKQYIADYANYTPDTLYTLDGTLYSTADGALYTDHGKLVSVYRAADASDTYSSTSSSCQVDKPSNAGYKFGDTMWQYKHTYSLNGVYSMTDKYDYKYYVGKDADGTRYVFRQDVGNVVPVRLKSITGDILAEVVVDGNGKIVSVQNRVGGVQWSRPWQADYEASLAA